MTINQTYAYYNTNNKVIEITLNISSVQTWNINKDYSKGDIVLYNGTYYIATKRNIPNFIYPEHFIGWVFWEIY
jgi:hypothetical protein